MLRRGDELDRYIILDPVGTGGAGMVYRAFDPDLERTVAIKILRLTDREKNRAWLLQEARALARVSHPNIVTVHDIGVWQDQVFIAMEMLEGSTFKVWIERERPSWRVLLRLFGEAALGLQAIHEAGLVHRDVKPSNLMISTRGHLVLVDFGLAQGLAAHDPGDEGRAPSGTWHFLAPELRGGGAPSFSSDLYALCLTFSEALEAPGMRAPRWLKSLLRRGHAAAPERRHASVQALRAAVRRRARLGRVSVFGTVGLGAAMAIAAVNLVRPDPSTLAATEVASRKAKLHDTAGVDRALASWADRAPERVEALERQRTAFERAWATAYASQLKRERTGQADPRSRIGRRCLEQVWARYATALRFGVSSPEHHEQIGHALAGIADPKLCGDDTNLAVDLPVPSDAARARSVEQVRMQIDEAMVRRDFVSADKVLPFLQALAPHVAALQFDPLTAEFEQQRSHLLLGLGRTEAAAEAAEAAVLHAARSGHVLATARATRMLVIALSELDRLDAAEVWAKRGLADTAGVPGLEIERAEILGSAAIVARRRDDFTGAERWLQEALALQDQIAAEPGTVVELQSELANLYADRNEAGPAIEAATAAASLMEAEVGALGQDAIAAQVNLGRVALQTGRTDFAATVLEDAVDRYRVNENPVYGSFARMLLGNARLRLGDTLGARSILDEAWATMPHDPNAAPMVHAKIAHEQATLARDDGRRADRRDWDEQAVAAAHRTGNDRFAQRMMAETLEALLSDGACADADRIAGLHRAQAADDRLVAALSRIDDCLGRPRTRQSRGAHSR